MSDRENFPPNQNEQAHSEQAGAEFLFPDDEQRSRLKTAVVSAGLGVLTVASATGVYFAQKNGLNLQEIVDSQYVPEPRVYPEIVDGFVTANNGLRAAAPFVVVAGVATQMGLYVAGKRSEHAQAVNQLAKTDYAGTEGIIKTDSRPSLLDRMRRRSAAIGVGLIATFTAGMTGGMSGVENEISNGPLRPVERTFDMLSTTGQDRDIIVQAPDITFMDDSWVDRQKIDALAADAATQGISVVPFGKTLPNIDGRSGLMITIPDELFAEISQEQGSMTDECDQPLAVIDEANSTPVGEEVVLNGLGFEVAEKIEGTAQMNRDIAIVSEDTAASCLRGQEPEDTPYFGAIISGAEDETQIQELLEEHDLATEATVISEEHFEDNNREFWRKNGTPITLILIGCVGVLGGAASLALRRGKLLANAREIAVMRGQGVSTKDIRSAETRRAIRESAASTTAAVPLMYGLATAFNAAEVGLKVGVGLREIASGYTVTLLANIIGSRRSAKYLEKNLDVVGAVKKG